MPTVKCDLKPTGEWKRMAAAVDAKRFQANLDANMNRATAFNGMMIAGEIRRRVKARKYAKNSPLTVLLKGSSTPLIDDADLWGAVTSHNIDKFTVFVGVLRSTMTDGGWPMTNLVELLHNGGQIPVTDHMRNLFIILSEVGQGKRPKTYLTGRAAEIAEALGKRIKDIKPFKSTTTHLVIKPRPFIKEVLDDPAIHKKCQANWQKAMKATFAAQAQSTSGGAPAGASASSPGVKAAKTKMPSNRSEAARRGWKTRRAKAEKKP